MLTSGIDALMMTKMHKCFAQIFGFSMIYGLLILCPLHYTGDGIIEYNGPDCKPNPLPLAPSIPSI
jgi:hypothetical protein